MHELAESWNERLIPRRLTKMLNAGCMYRVSSVQGRPIENSDLDFKSLRLIILLFRS